MNKALVSVQNAVEFSFLNELFTFLSPTRFNVNNYLPILLHMRIKRGDWEAKGWMPFDDKVQEYSTNYFRKTYGRDVPLMNVNTFLKKTGHKETPSIIEINGRGFAKQKILTLLKK